MTQLEIIAIAIAIPVFFLTMLVEYLVLRRTSVAGRIGYAWRDTLASLSMGSGYLVLSALAKLLWLPAFVWLHQYRAFDIPSRWWSWALLFLLQDFCFYWAHRSHHHVRFLWAAHVNHHSSQHYNLSTALRQSWTEHLTALPFYVPLVLLGFDPFTLAAVELFNLFYQYWVHTESVNSIGWLEWIFNSPSHHRVHHGSNDQYLDKNHAGILIIWDRIFGTFEPEVEPVRYGLTKNIDSHNPVHIAFHEWISMFRDVRAAQSVKHALGYIFRPPGWQATGRLQAVGHGATVSDSEAGLETSASSSISA
jgi:sterol desaturase/sphingolipid hydroxylase (fatty acid hydroxylase superfamily)